MSAPPLGSVHTEAPDLAETSQLAEATARLLPALERFNRFGGPDPAAREREDWQHRRSVREIGDRLADQ